ncbi:MAG: nucleotidyltransferase domain-containing protein, partial [Microcoleus sp. T1-bin1]|nr:nucleotidyltransferase domain-containing protein [Microcoleus sp. T1-bin1]
MNSQFPTAVKERFKASPSQIADFCQRWNIIELALFGSILRDDFRPDSDIDILASFAANSSWNLFDFIQMQER